MTIEVTGEAVEVLKRSLRLGRVDPATGGVRLRAARGLDGTSHIQVELAGGPGEGERTIEVDGLTVFIDPEVESIFPTAVIAVEPQHETIVVRSGGAGDAAS